jgi:UPF0176 protein
MSKPLPTAESPSVLNVSAYRFVPLTELPALREELHQRAQEAGLLGTILLAEEGINLMLAGEPDALRRFMDELQADPRFPDLPIKESLCEGQPFRFLKVKIKREIIRMNHPTLRPLHDRAPAVPARTLAKWLSQGHCDEGRPVVMVDTRNAFEVDAGTFTGALDWRLNKFSEFPQALAEHADELRDKTVVSFCTGGIRCEKAALIMQDMGLKTLQLEGGILRYFEETGSAPGWQGDCVVFDDRHAVHVDLSPRDTPAPRAQPR